jgi:hypothetical protein
LHHIFQVDNPISKTFVEPGYISKTNLSDGEQFNIDIQLTSKIGYQFVNISFAPLRQVKFYLYLSSYNKYKSFFELQKISLCVLAVWNN